MEHRMGGPNCDVLLFHFGAVGARVCRDIISGPVHQVHPSCVIMRLEEHLSCVVNVSIKLIAAK